MQFKCTSSVVYVFVAVLAFVVVVVHGEPQPMARPTRPEVFTSPEELRRYIDHVRDYYTLSGKARYGKRGKAPFFEFNANNAWNTVLDVPGSSQRTRLEKRKEEENRFVRELENPSNKKHPSRIDIRPCDTVDIVERYYGDV